MIEQIEKEVLGVLLNEPKEIVNAIKLKVTSNSFTIANHRHLFETMLFFQGKGEVMDVYNLSKGLSKRTKQSVNDCSTFIAKLLTEHKYRPQYLDLFLTIKEQELRLKIRDGANDILNKSQSLPDVLELAADLNNFTNEVNETTPRKSQASIYDIMKEAAKEVTELTQPNKGIDIGVSEITRKAGKFRKGNLIIVAGRPGMGKTAFALKSFLNGKPTLFFTMEMTNVDLINRLTVMESTLTMDDVFTSGIKATEKDKWREYITTQEIIAQKPLHIHQQGGISITELRGIAKSTEGIEFIIIDYLQLMKGHKGVSYGVDRTREINDITSSLKQLALDLNIPIMLLSQLNRSVESRADKRPQLSDLKQSGSIEEDADKVFFLYRPSYYGADDDQYLCEVITAKNRSGDVGTSQCHFDGYNMYFGDRPQDFTQTFDVGDINQQFEQFG